MAKHSSEEEAAAAAVVDLSLRPVNGSATAAAVAGTREIAFGSSSEPEMPRRARKAVRRRVTDSPSASASDTSRDASAASSAAEGADDDGNSQCSADSANQRPCLPHPFYYYRDHSTEVDEDPGTPLTPPSRAPNFPAKMHAILGRRDLEDIIAWLPHGRSWRVLDSAEFERRVLPQYFDHRKFSSFIRQANGWGFRRITTGCDRNTYYHELFLRGLPHLCKRMKRPGIAKKIAGDPYREPNFYEISKLHPVPEIPLDTLAASPSLSFATTASALPGSISSIGPTAQAPPMQLTAPAPAPLLSAALSAASINATATATATPPEINTSSPNLPPISTSALLPACQTAVQRVSSMQQQAQLQAASQEDPVVQQLTNAVTSNVATQQAAEQAQAVTTHSSFVQEVLRANRLSDQAAAPAARQVDAQQILQAIQQVAAHPHVSTPHQVPVLPGVSAQDLQILQRVASRQQQATALPQHLNEQQLLQAAQQAKAQQEEGTPQPAAQQLLAALQQRQAVASTQVQEAARHILSVWQAQAAQEQHQRKEQEALLRAQQRQQKQLLVAALAQTLARPSQLQSPAIHTASPSALLQQANQSATGAPLAAASDSVTAAALGLGLASSRINGLTPAPAPSLGASIAATSSVTAALGAPVPAVAPAAAMAAVLQQGAPAAAPSTAAAAAPVSTLGLNGLGRFGSGI